MKESRNFLFELYEGEDPRHTLAFEQIKEQYDKYVYIVHDRDVKETGELKKPHMHLVLMLDVQTDADHVAHSVLLDNTQFVQTVKGRTCDGVLRYLIHKDDPDKFQYDPKDVKGTPEGLKRFRKAIASGESEDDQMLQIMSYIDSCSFLTMTTLCRWAAESGLYSTLRRSAVLVKNLLAEHNGLVRRNSVSYN